jgi:hypothetical protein
VEGYSYPTESARPTLTSWERRLTANLSLEKLALKDIAEGTLTQAIIDLASQYGRYGYRIISEKSRANSLRFSPGGPACQPRGSEKPASQCTDQ